MKILDRAAGLLGYELRYFKKGQATGDDFVLFDFRGPNGEFNYQEYKDIQQKANKDKINNVWADEDTIKFIADYLKSRGALKAGKGICHGVRRGLEQKWFCDHLGADVIGTEISDTATQFPKTVQWDFHESKPEWKGAFDFAYSNSFDHAYDPEKALSAWVDQVHDEGCVFIEHSIWHSEVGASKRDPFGAKPSVMPFLIARWGRGRYCVSEVLQPPHTKQGSEIWIFVVRKTGA